MSEFEKNVIDRLARIESYLENDSKALYGNGKPGLLDRVSQLETQVKLTSSRQSWVRDSLGWLIATGVAIYAAVFK